MSLQPLAPSDSLVFRVSLTSMVAPMILESTQEYRLAVGVRYADGAWSTALTSDGFRFPLPYRRANGLYANPFETSPAPPVLK
jgi:hypothetical protein